MKKYISIMCMFALVLSCMAFFSGCGKDDSKTVMNVSLNPEVEFVLDADKKVVSVNALNEEGNLIINGQAFVGKSASEALTIFVEVSKTNGYLISGTVKSGENQIDISLSGDTKNADKIYNELKTAVASYCNKNGTVVLLNKSVALTKQYLHEQLELCKPYLEQAKIDAMEYDKLVEEIISSRKETANLHSQQLKEAYYQAKTNAIQMEKFKYVKSQMNSITAGIFDVALNTYQTAINVIESTRKNVLLNDDSVYQVALKVVNLAKVDYLKYRNYVASLEQNEITTAITTQLDSYKTALDNAETQLQTAYTTANTTLTTASNQVTTAYNTIVSTLTNLSVDMNSNIDAMENYVNTAITAYTTEFETNYATLITTVNTNINNMHNALVSTDD